MSAVFGVAPTALPLVVVAAALLLVGIAVARSLRDDAVLDALRAEVRTVGEVHRAVLEARTAAKGHPAPR